MSRSLAALMAPRFGALRSRGTVAPEAAQAFLGVLDQGVTALGSAIPVVLLGRLAGANELGIFSLALSVALFASIASQSLFLSGYPIFRAQDRAASSLYTFYAALFGVAAQAIFVPLCFLALLLWRGRDFGLLPALAIAAYVATAALRSYFRTLSLTRQDLGDILLLDTLALLIISGLFAWLAIEGAVSAGNAFLVLAFTNAVFAAAWYRRYAREMQPRLTGTWAYLKRSVDFGRWAFAGVGFGSLPYYATPWLLVLVRGTEETAVFAAASTIVGLVNHVLLGLLKGIESRTAEAFHRGGPAALAVSLKRTAWIVLPVMGAIVIAVFVAADPLAGLVLPGHAQEVVITARILSLALFVGSVRVIVGNGLWAMGLPRATFAADFIRGLVCLVLGFAGAQYAGAIGCAIAVLVGDAVSSLLVVAVYRARSQQARGARP